MTSLLVTRHPQAPVASSAGGEWKNPLSRWVWAIDVTSEPRPTVLVTRDGVVNVVPAMTSTETPAGWRFDQPPRIRYSPLQGPLRQP
jgi:hypothetical protein